MRRSFYTAPVDHLNLADWPSLGERLRRAAVKACGQDAKIEVGSEPFFTYETDVEETLLGLEDFQPEPRTVHIDFWNAIVHYGAVCVTQGDGIVRKERRALEKAVAKALRGETLIHDTEGAFDRHAGRVYGYRLNPDDDRDRVTFSHLMNVFDPPTYLGERWLLQEDDESLDEDKFTIAKKTPGQIVQFWANDEEAEERVWRHATRGEGLIALYDDDPDRGEITRGFSQHDDLRRMAGKAWHFRVTLGRCRPEDSLMVTYDLAVSPVEGAELLFVI